MSKQPPSYPLRLEPPLRAKLEALAHVNGRSLNAQIVLILETALKGDSVPDSLMGEAMRDEVRRIALEVFREQAGKRRQ